MARDKPGAADNVSERFELFTLAEGEEKITEKTDTRTPNSSIFTFNKEDHTVGNLVTERLHKNPHIVFAGYKVPHPLFVTFDMRIQTDGTLTPKQALVDAMKSLVSDLAQMSREFGKEVELRKLASTD